MVNFVTSDGQKWCVTASKGLRMVGPGKPRQVVLVEIWENGVLIGQGMSMCHPTDKFNPRKGLHLAVARLAASLPAQDRAALHKKLDTWVSR